MISCPHCDHSTDQYDVFCGMCGAYLERGSESAIFRKVRRRLPKYRFFYRWMFIFFGFYMAFYLLKWVVGYSTNTSDSLLVTFNVCFVVMLFGVIRFCECPACHKKMNSRYLIGGDAEALFCMHCGTRLRQGDGAVRRALRVGEKMKTRERCRCCGRPIAKENPFYCVDCGASLVYGEDGLEWEQTDAIVFGWRQVCGYCHEENIRSYKKGLTIQVCSHCGVTNEPEEAE